LEREIELVQRFVMWQPGQLQRVAEPAALAQSDFFFEEQIDEVEIAHLAGFSPLDELGECVGEVGESESGGVAPDPVSGQGAHEFSFGLARLA
jgi:hypothetical protein